MIANLLQQRSIIKISGDDRKKFLQGLISNDVNKTNENSLIYTAMLNAKGQFLYDFFIFEREETLFLDCASNRLDEIVKKLNFYKLRAAIKVEKDCEIYVAQSLEILNSQILNFSDPRSKNLGSRIYATKDKLEQISDKLLTNENYHFLRIKNKIAQGELDLTLEKSYILEFGFNELNAVDYNKGCYVGQELTARTHHLGEIRKKLFHITIDNHADLENFDSLKNCKISCEGKKLGLILSSAFYENKLHALALIRTSDLEQINSNILEVENLKISIIN